MRQSWQQKTIREEIAVKKHLIGALCVLMIVFTFCVVLWNTRFMEVYTQEVHGAGSSSCSSKQIPASMHQLYVRTGDQPAPIAQYESPAESVVTCVRANAAQVTWGQFDVAFIFICGLIVIAGAVSGASYNIPRYVTKYRRDHPRNKGEDTDE